MMSPYIGVVLGFAQSIKATGQYLVRCSKPPTVDRLGILLDCWAYGAQFHRKTTRKAGVRFYVNLITKRWA